MLPVASLPQWPWSSFPQAANLRPPKEFYVEVMGALRDALAPRPPLRVQPGFVSGEAARRRSVAFVSAVGTHRLGTQDVPPVVRRGSPGVCMGPDAGRSAVAARLAARGAPSPVPAMAWPAEALHEPRQRMTPQQEQFVTTVRDVDVDVALADLRAARTSDSTKAANSAAYPLYRLVCDKLAVPPWPPTTDTLEAFAAYLRFSGAYKAPQAYWWAIVQHARELGHFCAFDKAWADSMVLGLERDMPEHEQASPLTVPVLRKLATAVDTDKDFVLLLSLVAAVFCVARADCFLHLRPEDIEDLGPDRVKISLRNLKGQKRKRTLAPVFRRLPEQQPTSHFAPLQTARGQIVLCPVFVFRLLRAKATVVSAEFVAQCKNATYKTMWRLLDVLLTKAKVEQHAPGRDRKLFSMHSTRVAAVCYLLRAGLTETVVKALADWTSDQVARYGRRLILDPELVEPWAFYNPESGAYVDAPAYAPAAKRRRAGAPPPANAPPNHTPDLNRGASGGREGVGPQTGRAGLGRAGPGARGQGTKVAKGSGRRRGRK